jgi:hypothetical protein
MKCLAPIPIESRL